MSEAKQEVVELKNGNAVTSKDSQIITPMDMLNNAIEKGQSIEILTQLMDLQERYEKNNARKAFDEAMSRMREEMPVILKTSEVQYDKVKYKYEDLSSVTSALSPVMSPLGLSFRWSTDQRDGNVIVTCIITHKDGHYEKTTLMAAPDSGAGKSSIQAIGSTVTYLQRYTLKAAVGIAAARDDDGRSSEQTIQDNHYDNNHNADKANRLTKGNSRELYRELDQDIRSADSTDALNVWSNQRKADIDSLPDDWIGELRTSYMNRYDELKKGLNNDQQ